MTVIVDQKNRTKLRQQLKKGGCAAFKGALGTQQVDDILGALSKGNGLIAVKLVYDMGPLGLRCAKQLVDNLNLNHE